MTDIASIAADLRTQYGDSDGMPWDEVVQRVVASLSASGDVVSRARQIVADVFDEKANVLERAKLPNMAAVRIVREQADNYRRGKNDGTEQMAIARAALTASGNSGAVSDDLRDAVLWQLPRTHKGFHCTYDHDAVARAFACARRELDAGKTFKPCRCEHCKRNAALLNEGERS